VLAALLIEPRASETEPAQRAGEQPCASSWTPEVGATSLGAEPAA
jgi:hypothetical protein